MLANTKNAYGSVAKFFHWTIAFLILFLIALGIYMHELPNATAAQVEHKIWFFSLHKTLGVLTFFVALLRIIWALSQPKPKPLGGGRPYEHWLAETVHWILYGSLIIMPLSGWLRNAYSRGFAPLWLGLPEGHFLFPENIHLSEFFSWVHFFAGIALVIAIILHVAGAFKHFFIDRDGTLQRMAPFSRKGTLVSSPGDVEAKTDSKNASPFWAACAVLVVVFGIATIVCWNKFSSPEQAKNPVPTTQEQEANWIVDYPQSKLAITVDQSGTLTTGPFEVWTSSIHFDPDDLENARVEATIGTASLQLGGLSDQARSADFLNTEKFPVARFVSTDFVKRSEGGPEGESDGQYIARGTLALAGVEQKLDLPFRLEIKDEKAVMNTSISINRLDFGIGKAGFPDENTVNFAVKVDIHLVAVRR